MPYQSDTVRPRAPEPSDGALRIFISYARIDSPIADAFVETLEAEGFSVIIDRRDLPYGEEWQSELSDLMASSDSVLWLASPASIQSKWCLWELSEAVRLTKKVIPVRIGQVEPVDLPESLARVHLLPAEGTYNPAIHATDLAVIISTDRAWLKKATSLSNLAHEWAANHGDSARLLRGVPLTEAENWSLRTPLGAPAPAPNILEFILASRRAQRRLLRLAVTGALGVAFVAILLAAAALWYEREAAARELVAIQNESISLASLSTLALSEGRPVDALKLALAAWPRRGEEKRPMLARTLRSFAASLGAMHERQRLNHGAQLATIAYSPDGKRVITAGGLGGGNTPIVWSNGVAVLRLEGHSESVHSVRFSPDGSHILTVSSDDTARLWDAVSGRQTRLFKGHGARISHAEFSPDGGLVATASEDGSARTWDVQSGKEIARLSHDDEVNFVAFSPDGRRIVTASDDETARVWDAATASQIAVLRGHVSSVRRAIFSPDGETIATSGLSDETVLTWDATTFKETAKLTGLKGIIWEIAFSPDSRRIAGASQDKTAAVWSNLGVSGPPAEHLQAHSDEVYEIVFSPNSQYILTASKDGDARLWRVSSGKEVAKLDGHERDVMAAAFSPDGRDIATASLDGTARIWSISTAPELLSLDKHLNFVGFVAEGKELLTASDDGKVRIWSDAGELQLELVAHDKAVRSADLSRNGRYMLTGSEDATVRLWDLEAETPIGSPLPHGGTVESVRFSPGEDFALAVSNDGLARVWRVADQTLTFDLKSTDGLTRAASYAHNGKYIATGSGEGLIEIWNAADGRRVDQFKGDASGIAVIAFSPDDLDLIVGQSDGFARIWNLATRTMRLELAGHRSWILDVSYSPEGKKIATTSLDGSVRLWETQTGAEIGEAQHRFSVPSVDFAPDGTTLAIATARRVLLWDLDTLGQGSAFDIACNRLGRNTSLDDVAQRYQLSHLTPICDGNAPFPVDASKIE